MSELSDVTGGQIIGASFTNQVKERTVMRYASAATRDTSIPIPVEGSLAYLLDTNILTYYNGAQWVAVAAQNTGVKVAGTIVTQIRFESGLVDSGAQLASFTINNPGIPGGCSVQIEGVGNCGFGSAGEFGVDLVGSSSPLYKRTSCLSSQWGVWTSFGFWTFSDENQAAKLITVNTDATASGYYTGNIKVWVNGVN